MGACDPIYKPHVPDCVGLTVSLLLCTAIKLLLCTAIKAQNSAACGPLAHPVSTTSFIYVCMYVHVHVHVYVCEGGQIT